MLNAAIIGCGSIAPLHAGAISANDKSVLFAAADIEVSRAEEFRNQYGCLAFGDYREMLKISEIDVVHICTPHYLHTGMILDCLAAGKHVLTEKPLCISENELREITNVACKYSKKIGVCFQNRYRKTSEIIKEYLASGRGGDVKGAKAIVTWNREGEYYTSSPWKGRKSTEGGGFLINQAIHTIDLLCWFLGDVQSVEGSLSTRLIAGVIEVENSVEGIIRFAGGVNALLYATGCYCADSPVEIEIICEKAVLRQDNGLCIRENGAPERWFTDNEEAQPGGKAYWGNCHGALIDDFYDAVLTGRDFAIDWREGAKAAGVVFDFYRGAPLYPASKD